MIRVAKYAALAVGSLVVIGVGSVLLFWLGRPIRDHHRGEIVVDEDLLADDPGEDVDE